MMVIDNKFEIEDMVYVKTDVNQYPYHIVGFVVELTSILYVLQSITAGQYNARDYELSRKPSEMFMLEDD